MSLRGRAVMVTGATGFIGGRLIERLVLEEGATVRALVSSYSRCARIARFPVDLIRGDLLDQESVTEAAKGCDVIFHCAYGARGSREERRRVSVEGTERVLAAAAASGARLVHLSSQMVYGVRESGYIDESTPRRRSGSTYADSKLEAEEKVMRAAAQGLPVTVLQPTAVYGPHAPVWTVDVLRRMRAGRVPLIDGGEGICNAVYVDDVVSAALLAASSEAALGECFLVSAAEPVTWREFYGRYEAMLGVPATVPVSTSTTAKPVRSPSLWRELAAMVREEPLVRDRLRRTAEARLLAKLLGPLRSLRAGTQRRSATPELDRLRRLRTVDEPQVHPVAASDAAFFSARSRVLIDKARQRLGYRPRFSLDAGMEVTEVWARWAGLVPEGEEHQETLVAGTH
ncbi:MAG: NAD-dependent epimerase/dehydratase family protein [Trueperaceae bacterium]